MWDVHVLQQSMCLVIIPQKLKDLKHFGQRRLLISGQIMREEIEEVCLAAINGKHRIDLSQFLAQPFHVAGIFGADGYNLHTEGVLSFVQ